MDQIIELLDILGDRPLLVPDNKMGKKVTRLAKWIKKQKAPTDELAGKVMAVPSGSAAYRKIKYHLRLQLLNSITATSTDTITVNCSRRQANQQLWHQLAAIQTAPELYSRIQGNKLADNISKVANAQDLQDPLTLNILFQALYTNGTAKNSKEDTVGTTVSELYNSYLRGVVRSSQTSSTYMNKTMVPIEDKVNALRKLIDKHSKLEHHNYGPLAQSKAYIQMKIALYEGDLTSAKRIHDTRTKVLESEKVVNTIAIGNLRLNLLRCYAKSNQLEEGVELAKSILPLVPDDSVHKYGLLEVSTLLAMKSGKFQLAKALFNQAINHHFYSRLSDSQKETLSIIEAYLSLLISIGLLPEDMEKGQFTKFRIHKFLNDVVFSHKEKSFRNTHILIIKILDHCINRRHREFDYSEAIRKYVQRHLSEVEHTRSKNFLLALIQYPEHGYHLKMTMKHARKYLERMEEAPPIKYSSHAYQEIIPYETLWKIVTISKH